MHAYKDRVAVAVGDLAALGQGEEIIAAAGHDCAIAHALEVFFEANGCVECQMLFVDAAPLATDIMPAVTGIDDDRAEIGGVESADAASQQGEENEVLQSLHENAMGI